MIDTHNAIIVRLPDFKKKQLPDINKNFIHEIWTTGRIRGKNSVQIYDDAIILRSCHFGEFSWSYSHTILTAELTTGDNNVQANLNGTDDSIIERPHHSRRLPAES